MMNVGGFTLQAPQGSQLSETSPTILVVDDELPIIKLCKVLLEASGFTVLEADGSSEALKFCTQHRGTIDLLLADLVLPPPGFQLASTANQFPHLNGYDLAIAIVQHVLAQPAQTMTVEKHPRVNGTAWYG